MVVPPLEVLSNRNVMLSDLSSDRILILPEEFLLVGIGVPHDLLNLIGS